MVEADKKSRKSCLTSTISRNPSPPFEVNLIECTPLICSSWYTGVRSQVHGFGRQLPTGQGMLDSEIDGVAEKDGLALSDAEGDSVTENDELALSDAEDDSEIDDVAVKDGLALSDNVDDSEIDDVAVKDGLVLSDDVDEITL